MTGKLEVIRFEMETGFLADFSKRFSDAIQVRCSAKPWTIEFYEQQVRYLLAFDFLASRSLDDIDEAMVEQFAQARRQQVALPRRTAVSPYCGACCVWLRNGESWIGSLEFTFCEGSVTANSFSAVIKTEFISSFVRRLCTTLQY